MEVLEQLQLGFSIALQPQNLALAFVGVFLGTIIGMLPGVGPVNTIAILIPITFVLNLSPASSIIMFAGIYYGSQYGNSISSILLNVPGTSSAVVTALDGYPMSQQGRAGPALAISAIASFIGGTLSIFFLIFFAPILSQWAIDFGPAEYVVLMLFGFASIASLTGNNVFKGLIAAVFGLILATVGLDPQGTTWRFTFGFMNLLDGLDFVVIAIGFFAISEVLHMLTEKDEEGQVQTSVGRVFVTMEEFLGSFWTIIRSSISGFVIGSLPGAGTTIASFVAYTTEKQLLDKDGTFGKGDIRGVAAPESSNNSASIGAFIPMLTLGVPGSGTTAVMLAALMSLNVTPGPLLIQNEPEVFWGLVASMYIGNLILLLLNLPLVGLFARVLLVPKWVLMPAVGLLSVVGVYAVNNNPFDLFLMALFGLIGYFMRKLDFPLAPVILALILGWLLEDNLRKALIYSDGDWTTLFASPITLVLWGLTALSLFAPVIINRFRGKTELHLEGESG